MTRPAPSPGGERLAAALRESRDRTGLSLAALAAKTAYSKSSWERYLNGRTLPPRPAIQELCRLAGEPDARCLALWEIAKSESVGRPKERTQPRPTAPPRPPTPQTAAPAPAPTQEGLTREVLAEEGLAQEGLAQEGLAQEGLARVGHRLATAAAIVASVCAVVFGAVTVALVLLPHQKHTPRPKATPSATGPHCRAAACEGQNPLDMRCAAVPETLAEHVTGTGASIQLRHSAVCGTSWARMWGTRIDDRIEVTATGDTGRTRRARVENRTDADGYVYTPMTVTRPGTLVRACFLPAAGGGQECFEARVGRDAPGAFGMPGA
ncbi:helix-turn-helix domain-containing protein [Streptomyces adustus]|uniref:helix-turn-helix domain-containing protein n=1 Tax=Streptomyces adustus TaxID=1609272 RepID=UPI003717F762